MVKEYTIRYSTHSVEMSKLSSASCIFFLERIVPERTECGSAHIGGSKPEEVTSECHKAL